MADDNLPVHEADAGHGEHGAVHLPPPSFAPINVAFALATTLHRLRRPGARHPRPAGLGSSAWSG